DGGVRGQVTRKSFLGEIVDYQVRIGSQEVRIQKGRRTVGPNIGESCGVHFRAPLWYRASEAE
ncbi:MAG: TOBE domain-containing protein, partial [Desulfovibrionaceae bacterium]|nr:TOBE domain-containing protein [Desulfovibrionaceae bacterium]